VLGNQLGRQLKAEIGEHEGAGRMAKVRRRHVEGLDRPLEMENGVIVSRHLIF
jgi:hypothetical protein